MSDNKKTAIITGGLTGIGKATAELMTSKGWEVIPVGKEGYHGPLPTSWWALVNSAGVAEGDMMAVNYGVTLEWCLKALAGMMRGGHIVNVGSACALPNAPISKGGWPYAVSKYAVHGFTRAFSLDVAEKNIKINCVAPEGVNTEMYNKFHVNGPPAVIQPEDVAEVIWEQLNTEDTGQIIPVMSRDYMGPR